MIIFAQEDQYFCALLEKDTDYPVFFQSHQLCCADSDASSIPDHYRMLVLGSELEDADCWLRDIFKNPNIHFFVLFEDLGGDQCRPVGEISVQIQNGIYYDFPNIEGIYSLSSYRGQGLSKILYGACLRFLAEETGYPMAYLQIDSTNVASIKAAKKSGFVLRGNRRLDNGGCLLEFCRSLDDLRHAPHNGLAPPPELP